MLLFQLKLFKIIQSSKTPTDRIINRFANMVNTWLVSAPFEFECRWPTSGCVWSSSLVLRGGRWAVVKGVCVWASGTYSFFRGLLVALLRGFFKPFSPFRRRSMERSLFLLFFEVWFFVPGEGNWGFYPGCWKLGLRGAVLWIMAKADNVELNVHEAMCVLCWRCVEVLRCVRACFGLVGKIRSDGCETLCRKYAMTVVRHCVSRVKWRMF